MMWFFAILIVLAMGGVAVLAAGRGAPLAEVYDDRPDVAVPADGPLTADDLRRVRFSLALRGYRMSRGRRPPRPAAPARDMNSPRTRRVVATNPPA